MCPLGLASVGRRHHLGFLLRKALGRKGHSWPPTRRPLATTPCALKRVSVSTKLPSRITQRPTIRCARTCGFFCLPADLDVDLFVNPYPNNKITLRGESSPEHVRDWVFDHHVSIKESIAKRLA